jgi:hypothetical protein
LLLFVVADAVHEVVQVADSEFPAERPGGLVAAVHEAEQGPGQLLEAGEVVRGDGFLLDDGEKISDLVQPGRVQRVWIMRAFGWARASRVAAAWPAAGRPARLPRPGQLR